MLATKLASPSRQVITLAALLLHVYTQSISLLKHNATVIQMKSGRPMERRSLLRRHQPYFS